jgi:5-methylcytosine-specific restriction protein B
MNYWHIQLHPNNKKGFPVSVILDILESKNIIGIGDTEDEVGTIPQFTEEMRTGDIVAVKNGATPIALVKVIGDSYIEDNTESNFDWFPIRRKIEVLDIYKESYNFKINQPRGTLSICRDLQNDTSQTIINWHHRAAEESVKIEVEKLLKYKYQVILQGPPGTGKTRLAKQIAQKMCAPQKIEQPLDKISQFFKVNSSTEELLKIREHNEVLINEFQTLFPKEAIKEISLENYSIGTGESSSFCWWIERGLKELGYYFPGSARSYLIYWNKGEEEYKLHGKILKDITEPEEGIIKIVNQLHTFVETKNFSEAAKYFGNGYLLKILHSYYPDEFFPVNSVNCLENILKILGIDFSSMSALDKNKAVQDYFLSQKKENKSDATSLEFMSFLFQNFDLKGKLTIDEGGILLQGEYKLIQFHPAYSYEDFVRGIVAKTTSDGKVYYEVENKTLATFAQTALDNPSANYVLIIDEINRANLPSVLGELIYALEYRYDEQNKEETTVSSMYSLSSIEDTDSSKLQLPKNLFIIGTMNTADRSVGHIDYAIRRRFAFKNVLPNPFVIKNEKSLALFLEVSNLFSPDYLAPDFTKEDVQIGHSYFICDDLDLLKLKLEYEIKPILNEYLKDGILLSDAKVVIDNLHV